MRHYRPSHICMASPGTLGREKIRDEELGTASTREGGARQRPPAHQAQDARVRRRGHRAADGRRTSSRSRRAGSSTCAACRTSSSTCRPSRCIRHSETSPLRSALPSYGGSAIPTGTLARLWPKFEWASDSSRRKTRGASISLRSRPSRDSKKNRRRICLSRKCALLRVI